MSDEIPYEELDGPVRGLVRVLNEFDGITTLGSCGGHETPVSGASAAANEWWVTFELEPADANGETTAPSDRAWLALEFLAYVINTSGQTWDVLVAPYAVAPQLNEPGRMLRFELRGYRDDEDGAEPDQVAKFLREVWLEGE
jgi:hypothetical protein